MYGENGSREPRTRKLEACEQAPDEQRVDGLQEDVHQVVAEGLEAKEGVLEAKRAVDHRDVLGGCVHGEPDPPQPVGCRKQRVGGHVVVVVPDEARFQRGGVGGHGHADQQQGEQSDSQQRPLVQGLAG